MLCKTVMGFMTVLHNIDMTGFDTQIVTRRVHSIAVVRKNNKIS